MSVLWNSIVFWESDVAFYGLEDETEDVSCHFIVSEPSSIFLSTRPGRMSASSRRVM
jgi:hypothetical protein